MKNIRFICAQPAIKYYAWQVEVMLHNFKHQGVNLNQVDIVSKIDHNHVPDEWQRLSNNYSSRFFFYNDLRETRHYISSIRPNLLAQHWRAFPELQNEIIFYHDCDIAFTKPINLWLTEDLLNNNVWYGSDTRWYIAHSYIKSKGDDVLQKMCEIVNISPEIVELNELNTIGAQCLMKNVTDEFWVTVERDCEQLFHQITLLNNEKKIKDPSHHELQIWCADMWALLWNAWKKGHQTRCHENFNFSWGTSSMEEYNKCNIYHNAGVTSATGGLFYKAAYMNSYPFNLDLDITADTASRQYYDIIQNVGTKSVLL